MFCIFSSCCPSWGLMSADLMRKALLLCPLVGVHTDWVPLAFSSKDTLPVCAQPPAVPSPSSRALQEAWLWVQSLACILAEFPELIAALLTHCSVCLALHHSLYYVCVLQTVFLSLQRKLFRDVWQGFIAFLFSKGCSFVLADEVSYFHCHSVLKHVVLSLSVCPPSYYCIFHDYFGILFSAVYQVLCLTLLICD